MPRTPKPIVPLTAGERSLVAKNYFRALHWVGKFRPSCPDIPLDELRSICFLALCSAAQRWDPERGSFSNCYKHRVRREIDNFRRSLRPRGFKNPARGVPPRTTYLSPGLERGLADDTTPPEDDD